MGKKKGKAASARDSPEPGIVWRNVTRSQADDLLRDTPTGTYLVRPSAHGDDTVALSVMMPSREISHILLFHTEDGWTCENVEHPRRFLYSLLERMPIFINSLDSERLVPGLGDTVHHKSLKTFLIERHDIIGILMYHRSFSGLTRGRRILHLFVAILLLVGANIFAFSSLDGSCYKIQFCHDSCVESLGEAACQARNVSVTVTDLLDTRVTEYRPLYVFPLANLTRPAHRAAWSYCAAVTNPIWDYSPVCLILCRPKAEKFILSDNVYQWSTPPGLAQCQAGQENPDTQHVLACEHAGSRAYPQLVGLTKTDPEPIDTCASFRAGAESPSAVAFLLKASAVAAFLLVTYAIMKRVLLLSQPVSARQHQVRRDRTRLVKLSTSCLACFAVSGLFLFASALIAFGAYLIGEVVTLWTLFLSGIAVSVTLKFLVFQPLQITALWLLMRSGLYRLISDRSARALAKQATLDELDLSQVKLPAPAPPRRLDGAGRKSLPGVAGDRLHGRHSHRSRGEDDFDAHVQAGGARGGAKVSTFTDDDGPPFHCPFKDCEKFYETAELLARHREIRGHLSQDPKHTIPPLALSSPKARQSQPRQLSARRLSYRGGAEQGAGRALSARRRRDQKDGGAASPLPVGRRRGPSPRGGASPRGGPRSPDYRSVSELSQSDLLSQTPSVRRDMERLREELAADDELTVAPVVVSRGCCMSSICLAFAVFVASVTILILESAGCTTPSAVQRAGRTVGVVSTALSALAILVFSVQFCRRHRLANCTVVLTTISCSIVFFLQIGVVIIAYALVYSNCSYS